MKASDKIKKTAPKKVKIVVRRVRVSCPADNGRETWVTEQRAQTAEINRGAF